MNAWQIFADSFQTKKLSNYVADFLLLAKCNFIQKSAVLRFEPPFFLGGGVGATYDDHLRLSGKRAVDFLFVLINWTLFR